MATFQFLGGYGLMSGKTRVQFVILQRLSSFLYWPFGKNDAIGVFDQVVYPNFVLVSIPRKNKTKRNILFFKD